MRETNPGDDRPAEGSAERVLTPPTGPDRRRLAALLGDPRLDDARLLSRLRDVRSLERLAACSAAVELLVGLELPEMRAEGLLIELFHWRAGLATKLNRQPSLAVAAMDLLLRREGPPHNPVAVELAEREPDGRQLAADPLSGLNHRRVFELSLATAIRRGSRHGAPLALVVADLDSFKSVNDLYGHPLGDHVLRRAGRLVRRNFRESDSAWRLDGDEFVIMLPEGRQLGAWSAAERLRLAVQTTFSQETVDGRVVAMTVSCGVACYPFDGGTADLLLGAARRAVARAKVRGANRVMIHPRERRRSVRLPARPTTRAKLGVGTKCALQDVKLVDLGCAGALVETARTPPGAEPLLLVLESVGRSTMLHGRVARHFDDGADGLFRIAMVFEGELERSVVQGFAMTSPAKRIRS